MSFFSRSPVGARSGGCLAASSWRATLPTSYLIPLLRRARRGAIVPRQWNDGGRRSRSSFRGSHRGAGEAAPSKAGLRDNLGSAWGCAI
jgi:hypothetical protein